MSQILYLSWDENHLTGVPIVDEQHRGLVATINSLYYFIQKGWELKSLKPTILMLEQYIVFHLRTEESMLSENGLPDNILASIQEYRSDFLTTLNDVVESAIQHHEPEELASFLAKWWLGHNTEFHDKLEDFFQIDEPASMGQQH